MGHLQAFDLRAFIDQYNLQIYVETGTGIGDTLSYAIRFGFSALFSIDMDETLYKNAVQNFQDSRLTLINAFSREALPNILSDIPLDKACLFFLDAHFPKADFGIGADRYLESVRNYGKDSTPLEEELLIIKKYRSNLKDVIIIDDVWIYEEGPFEVGNWSERMKLSLGNMSFVYKIYEESHIISIYYKQQGYMVLIPKEVI